MTTVEAKLGNRGSGMLELVNNNLKFYVEKGRFKKHIEIIREIPLTDVEKATLEGNELSVTWKGVADIFLVEKTESATTICEEINSAMRGQTEEAEDQKANDQKRIETAKIVTIAWEIGDYLFDLLMNLQGRVDWNRQETALKRFVESAKNLPTIETSTANLDSTRLEATIKAHRSEEVSKEAYGILKAIDAYLNKLAANGVLPQKIHPDYNDAKQMVLAYYTLNDIIFGTIVGDKEIEKEKNELALMLDRLSKTLELKIDVEVIKRAASSLVIGEIKEGIIEESREVFRQQFAGLFTN
jgi:hypothetical protein